MLNGDIDRRLTEIERFMAALSLQRDPQNKMLKELEQRLDAIDAKLQSMHK